MQEILIEIYNKINKQKRNERKTYGRGISGPVLVWAPYGMQRNGRDWIRPESSSALPFEGDPNALIACRDYKQSKQV